MFSLISYQRRRGEGGLVTKIWSSLIAVDVKAKNSNIFGSGRWLHMEYWMFVELVADFHESDTTHSSQKKYMNSRIR